MKGPIEGRDTSTVVGQPTEGPLEVFSAAEVREDIRTLNVAMRSFNRSGITWHDYDRIFANIERKYRD